MPEALTIYRLDLADQPKNAIATNYKVDTLLFLSQIIILQLISGLALVSANEKFMLSD